MKRNRKERAPSPTVASQRVSLKHLASPPFAHRQCWGSERFYSDSDSDSDPAFQTDSDSDSAPFGSGSESEYIRIRIRILHDFFPKNFNYKSNRQII